LLSQVAALFVAPEAEATPVAPVAGDPKARLAPLVAGEADARRVPVVVWEPPSGSRWLPASSAAGPAEDGATRDEPDAVSGRQPPVDAAVLAAGTDAMAVGAALAGELRARGRHRTALVLVWDPRREAPNPTPAWPCARNLAAELAVDQVVAPRGRIVLVQLPHEPEAAAIAASRLSREASVPTVMVVAGPRTSVLNELLSTCDVLVVLESAGLPGYVAELATAELRLLNPRVLVERPLGGAARRLLAHAGVSRARRLRARMEELLP
jgi:hypothetical protein